MLELRHICKTYVTGSADVQALTDVNLQFRSNEFVAILGPSGGGKTTLLNLIGGLDKYDSGDLIINGVTTKKYKDKDWDSYRNHTVGFVFQNYNLITHQSVLANVELALTLSGVSKTERRERAKKALESVGLADQMNKKPNQMSGGQMQRVAIARALVNNPDILLADEPTGALDTVTSVQIMELLKDIAKDKLVIMVTHNPELADKYANRVIKILDGKIIDDSNPYSDSEKEVRTEKTEKTSMGFLTALSLSFKNLLTKKGRTFLTAFAGSIGIIGIAAILALSNGVQLYIDRVEQDTLSSYPLSIEKATFDMTSVMQSMIENTNTDDKTYVENDQIYVRPIINEVLKSVSTQIKVNNLKDFKKFIDDEENGVKALLNGVQYTYDLNINIYGENYSKDGFIQSNPNDIVSSIGFSNFTGGSSQFAGVEMIASSSIWTKLLDNPELLQSQYDVIAGRWPEKYNEVVFIVNKNNEINDYVLYTLGLKNQDEITEYFNKMVSGEEIEETEGEVLEYSDILGKTFKLVLNTDYFVKENNMWLDKSDDKEYIKNMLPDCEDLTVVGIIRQAPDAVNASISGYIGYLTDLESYVIDKVNNSEIVKEQQDNPDVNVFTGLKFEDGENGFDMSTLTPEQQQMLANMTPEQLSEIVATYTENANATYDGNLKKMGYVDVESPSSINLYPKDFESKESLTDLIDDYNTKAKNEDREEDVIVYTDMMAILISSVTNIVDIVSYVLIAFVSISLVVSSIMIGIITYISVLERTKEIGILRAIGASKKDIARVFNAETLIVGLIAGIIGVVSTVLITIPVNIIIKDLTDVSNLAQLPIVASLILIAISVFLTMFAGLIPSRVASKKDPVVALRTE